MSHILVAALRICPTRRFHLSPPMLARRPDFGIDKEQPQPWNGIGNRGTWNQKTMSARCHWQWASLMRGVGATGVIVACFCALALAGSPQLHEHMHHASTGAGHSCTITLCNAGKCLKAVTQPVKPLVIIAPVIVLTKHPVITSVWVRTLFLEACRFEHGPPVLPGCALS